MTNKPLFRDVIETFQPCLMACHFPGTLARDYHTCFLAQLRNTTCPHDFCDLVDESALPDNWRRHPLNPSESNRITPQPFDTTIAPVVYGPISKEIVFVIYYGTAAWWGGEFGGPKPVEESLSAITWDVPWFDEWPTERPAWSWCHYWPPLPPIENTSVVRWGFPWFRIYDELVALNGGLLRWR